MPDSRALESHYSNDRDSNHRDVRQYHPQTRAPGSRIERARGDGLAVQHVPGDGYAQKPMRKVEDTVRFEQFLILPA
jgi:hypothetical protein